MTRLLSGFHLCFLSQLCSSDYFYLSRITKLVSACWFCTALPGCYQPWPSSWTLSADSVQCCPAVIDFGLLSSFLHYPPLVSRCSCVLSWGAVASSSSHLLCEYRQPTTTALMPLYAFTLSVSAFRSLVQEVYKKPPQYSSSHQVCDKETWEDS